MNIQKLITSSADAQKLSLTVKGLLTSLAPIAVVVLGLHSGEYGTLVDSISAVIFYGGSLISALITITGLLRKVSLGRWSAL